MQLVESGLLRFYFYFLLCLISLGMRGIGEYEARNGHDGTGCTGRVARNHGRQRSSGIWWSVSSLIEEVAAGRPATYVDLEGLVSTPRRLRYSIDGRIERVLTRLTDSHLPLIRLAFLFSQGVLEASHSSRHGDARYLTISKLKRLVDYRVRI